MSGPVPLTPAFLEEVVFIFLQIFLKYTFVFSMYTAVVVSFGIVPLNMEFSVLVHDHANREDIIVGWPGSLPWRNGLCQAPVGIVVVSFLGASMLHPQE